jgi:uncharacterized protein YndB with AHSA1/START domain/DNA-binding transcriptional ArsR family regulator
MCNQMAAYPHMDEVFRALADPSRRQLLDRLNDRNGQTLRELCSGLDMARQSVSKHLAILEAANLVTTIRRGREKLHYLNAAPINEIAERWITQYERDRVHALADLKRALEDTPMNDKPSFVYTTYIKTTPEQLWRALTDPAFTRRYWNIEFETDWQAGSPMTWHQRGVAISDPEQVVLESEPYHRLSYTWHSWPQDFVDALDLSDDVAEQIAAEPRSKVTFDIEDLGGRVKLTVLHAGFEEDSVVIKMISGGWPSVLSDLKTLLETGETLPPSTEPIPPARLGLTKS